MHASNSDCSFTAAARTAPSSFAKARYERARYSVSLVALSALLVAFSAEAVQWSVSDPGQGPYMLPANDSGANQLSAIVWVSGNQYYALSDTTRRVYPLAIELNPNGTIQSATLAPGILLSGADDPEGLVYHSATGGFLASDEVGPAIREHASDGGLVQTLTLPPVFQNIRLNLALEGLTRDPASQALWTANEEALINDGAPASFTAGSTVRLQRFDASYAPNGQWAYVTDPLPGDVSNPGRDVESSGVSDLIAIAGGDLLVLERASGITALRSRLYQVGFAGASDTSSLANLDGADFHPVSKTLLWSRNSLYNFEGASLGPTLEGGGRSLLLIADDGSGLPQGLQALVLRQAVCGNGVVEAPETCDDFNTSGGDGCSAQCRTESCGDGVLNNSGNESCDDANQIAGDGCDVDCQLELPARRCQEAIFKAARGYGFDRLKALRNCRDQLNRGRPLFLDAAKTQPLTDPADCAGEYETASRITRAGLKLRNAVGERGRCTDAYVGLFDACAENVDGLIAANGGSGCLQTSHDAAVDRIIDDQYGRALQPTESLLRRCQQAIAKAAGKYAETRWQALHTCQVQLLKGRTLFADELRQQPLV
ncbi:MAG TPA: esterase-like activity of phytase family protein, partial [Terriglobales bacterium]|nr:esterase-like activity of phytase family protein [Terriglobales bacterium]